ncbi:GNAT family N-acetyltransferase [Paenibacillaceae bacterium WGS1546]|uniref:GNAT family N-acetyltransferase n=1 Tax=Cohnella sp. WGS1546 TaxID=3366810 RepID=UPI00372D7D96
MSRKGRQYGNRNDETASRSVYVHQLSVNESERGRGLGAMLMNRIETMAGEKGIRTIELDYWTDNDIAKQFYARRGYRVNREFVYKDLQEAHDDHTHGNDTGS